MIARITVLCSCVNMHCTLTLPVSTGSLNWYMHVVGNCCYVRQNVVGLPGQERQEGWKQYT